MRANVFRSFPESGHRLPDKAHAENEGGDRKRSKRRSLSSAFSAWRQTNAYCGTGGRWFEPTQLYQPNSQLYGIVWKSSYAGASREGRFAVQLQSRLVDMGA